VEQRAAAVSNCGRIDGNQGRMECRNEVPAASAACMASSTSAGFTVIGSLWMGSSGAVARLATVSSSSSPGLPMPMSANVVGRRTLFENVRFNEPVSTVLRVNLHAGTNTLSFGNAMNYAPDLDRIVIAPAAEE
jgi:alpha-galactosidase